ncbi:MAG: hypothetical protein R6V45_05645 [Oceanipulchritudo sp.]
MTRLILAFGILCLGGFYFLLTGWYPDVAWLQRPLLSQVWPLAAILLAGGVLLAGPRLGFRDTALAGWAAFSLAGCLLVLPLAFAKREQVILDDRAEKAIVDLRQEVRLEVRRREAEAAEAERKERASRPKDRYTQYEGQIDFQSLEAIRELDERMQARMKERADAYRKAMDENPVLGPSAWLTFRSLEQLEQEQRHHQRLYETARTFTRFVETFEDTYNEAIEELALEPSAKRIAVAEMERVLQSWEQGHTYTIRKLDLELLSSALAALEVLISEWGAWTYSPRDSNLSFEDSGREAAFIEAMGRFRRAAEAVSEISSEQPPS